MEGERRVEKVYGSKDVGLRREGSEDKCENRCKKREYGIKKG